jgi:RecA/RadA recombinase
MALNRKPSTPEQTEKLASSIKEEIDNGDLLEVEKKVISWKDIPIVSTGSTLLDLSISGGRVHEGGIPCCVLAEIHGPAGSGKTALLAAIGANVQAQGGEAQLQDPEARVDKEYARIYQIELDKTNYHRPETVSEVFTFLQSWKTEKKPKALLTDSIAALTTEREQDDKDAYGMQRAKEFSAGFRKNARIISDMLWVCSNQEREGDNGTVVTPGGKAVGFYASLRIRIVQKKKIEIIKKNSYGVEVKKIIGIQSECFVGKSTIDDPYRVCPLYIVFGLGLDNVRCNLQYLKDMQKLTSYPCPDGKNYMSMEQAITHVEENNLSKDLAKQTTEMWHEIENLFNSNRNRR